ncbi:hypothetical protein BRO54_1415 [Geobacillus proteiniphilus]|uniref:Uncharacterized protein n=1 Tax=Geobacillus proteiniphilus TaxID=860353 RepID=A0A1Q5T372_9BACL|nr:hypothetical protein BRO54_1415 [Geobacillus proteiniphilus]
MCECFERKSVCWNMINGRECRQIVAETDGHARWFRWEADGCG